ncbi:MAG: hypothetical protein AB1440_26490 [Pseudomonadota bacterium]|jgi:hypothetical protein
MKDPRWQDWVTTVAGLTVVFSPWTIPSLFPSISIDPVASWALLIVGGVIAVIGLSALANPHRWEEWAEIVLGLCLIGMPYTLGFDTTIQLTWTVIFAGSVVVFFSGWALIFDNGNIPYERR